jgi:hypothetical protein
MFSVLSVPRIYNEEQCDLDLDLREHPCGCGVEYLHSGPEDRGGRILQTIDTYLPVHTVSSQKTIILIFLVYPAVRMTDGAITTWFNVFRISRLYL